MNYIEKFRNNSDRVISYLSEGKEPEEFQIDDPYMEILYESGNVKLAKSLYLYKRDGHTAIIAAQRLIRAQNFPAAIEQLDVAKEKLQALRKEIGEYKTDSIFVNLVGMLIGMCMTYVDDGLGGLVQSVITTVGDTVIFGPVAAATGFNPRTLTQTVRDIDANYQELKSTAKITKANAKKKEADAEKSGEGKKKKSLKDKINEIDLTGFNVLYMRACNAANDIEICIEKLQRQIKKMKPSKLKTVTNAIEDTLVKKKKKKK